MRPFAGQISAGVTLKPVMAGPSVSLTTTSCSAEVVAPAALVTHQTIVVRPRGKAMSGRRLPSLRTGMIEQRGHLRDSDGEPTLTNAEHLPRSVFVMTSGGASISGSRSL